MATCFCRQPCEKHKFPMQTKEGWAQMFKHAREFKVSVERAEILRRLEAMERQ